MQRVKLGVFVYDLLEMEYINVRLKTANTRVLFLKGAVLITAVAAHYYCYQIEGIVFVLLVTNGVTPEGRINLQTNDIKII